MSILKIFELNTEQCKISKTVGLVIRGSNIVRPMVKLSMAVAGKNLKQIQQNPVKGVYWKYFCTFGQAPIRMLQRSTSSVIVIANAHQPRAVTNNVTAGEILPQGLKRSWENIVDFLPTAG